MKLGLSLPLDGMSMGAQRGGIRASLKFPEKVDRLPRSAELAILRILQGLFFRREVWPNIFRMMSGDCQGAIR
jgi:hypothetical protein